MSGFDDSRTELTLKSMFSSLLSLMEKRDYDDIRIEDICEKALISQATFYRNFESKDDLLERGLLANLDEVLAAAGPREGLKGIETRNQ